MIWTTIDPALDGRNAEEEAARFASRYPAADPRIFSYASGVLSGETLACMKIRLAMERFMRDLDRVDDPAFPWMFDPERASRPIRFTERWMHPHGAYDRMVLMPWQCFFLANVFGWVQKESGLRKYTKVLLVVGSGNGKTPLVAAAALYIISQLGIKDAEVNVLANSKEQADLIMGDCRAMIDASPALKKRFKPKLKQIEYYTDGYEGKGRSVMPDAVMRNLSTNAKTMDGGRPTTVIFDELHAMESFDTMKQQRRSLDKCADPLLMMISTMGYVLDGVLVSEYRNADQVLKGIGNPVVNDRVLALIYELDELDDPANHNMWCKANPSLGVLLDIDRMRARYEEAKIQPNMMGDFLTKTLNIFTKVSAASFLDWKLVERNQDMIDLEAIRGREAFGGFDISSSGDHTSVCLEVPLDDGRLFVMTHTFVPRAVAERDAERLDYYSHAMQGNLTIIDGEYVKQEYLVEWFEKWAEIFDIRCIGYDPANATLLVKTLTSWRGEDKPIFTCDPVRQGALTLNAPMKHVKECFIDGRIVHNQSRLFEWYLNNVKLRQDYLTKDKENWVPVKLDKFSKIDAFMAFLDAHTVWMRLCPAAGAEPPADDNVQIFDLTEPLNLRDEPKEDFWFVDV